MNCPNRYNCHVKEENGYKSSKMLINMKESINGVVVYECSNCGYKISLPVEQGWAKDKIDYFENEIQKLIAVYIPLIKEQKDIHKKLGCIIVPTDVNIREKLKTNKWSSCGAICVICEKDFGWFCSKNPDPKKPYCEYDRTHGESCIHCGMPSERK